MREVFGDEPPLLGPSWFEAPIADAGEINLLVDAQGVTELFVDAASQPSSGPSFVRAVAASDGLAYLDK